MLSPLRVVGLALGLLWGGSLLADPALETVSTNPPPDALAAMQRLRVAPGLKLDLWASEPLVQNLTSLSFDHQGRAYVVETGRRRTSVFDVRGLQPWLEDDFAFRTVKDRADFLRRVLDPESPDYPAFREAVTKAGRGGFQDFNQDGVVNWRDLEVESERIRLVWDSDASGSADKAVTFADGFNSSVSGVAAGVLAEGTNVWFTSIPDLWKLPAGDTGQVTRGDSAASRHLSPATRHSLLSGFGVHIAFGGHDLHGLIKGPDGRIYFTIADRGACVTNREGRVISLPDTGAVFRCEPDGANFEVFAQGLRNPQELAFDDLGNLWTADNNGDGGDKARWTLVLEGADYGWTIGWQWLPKMGAWNSERLWHTRESNTAAYLVPPVAHIGHGPAGIAHYPGTGLGERYRDHFFYADFPGGIRTFRVEPDGAFFKVGQAASLAPGGARLQPGENVSTPALGGNLAPPNWLEDNSAANFTGKLLWDLSPVDVTFPPFGGVIVADWVQGWEKTGKGRLWHITDPALANDPQIAEVRRLLAEGMAKRSEKDLLTLLGHQDQRVRLEAQWELAGRGMPLFRALKKTATESQDLLTRIHAIWAMGQIFRGLPVTSGIDELFSLLPLLNDPEPEIRGQAAKMFAAGGLANASDSIVGLLQEPSPRLRLLALEALAGYRTRRWKEPLNARAASVVAGAVSLFSEDMAKDIYQSHVWREEYSIIPGTWAAASLIATNGTLDPAVFHAATRILSGADTAPHDGLSYLGKASYPEIASHPYFWHPSRFGWGKLSNAPATDRLQLVILLGMRRHQDAWIREFLKESNPQIVLEAARAINDVPIPAALPALAALLQPGALDHVQWAEEDGSGPPSPRPSPPGRGGNAASLSGNEPSRPSASTAASPNNPPLIFAPTPDVSNARPNASPSPGGEGRGEGGPTLSRSDSLNFTRDEWRTWVLRRAVNAAFRLGGDTNATALAQFAARSDAPESVRVEALEALADWPQPPKRDKIVGLHRPLPPRDPAPARQALAAVWSPLITTDSSAPLLVAALKAGAALEVATLPESLAVLAEHRDEPVRKEVARIQSARRPVSVSELAAQLEQGGLAERQAAFARLGRSTDPQAAGVLAQWLARLLAGQIVPELHADVLEAAFKAGQAASQPDSPLGSLLARWTNSLPAADPLARHRPALTGGDAANGRRLFAERADWACQRCHKLGGEGGDVGPDITGLGRSRGREYVLRAILDPNAEIAPGYESVVLEKQDDSVLIGILKEETASELVLVTPEEGRVTVPKSELKSRARGLSAMPDGLGDLMTLRELRDVVEALSQ